MTTLKFIDTHNMVAFLSKSAKSEGFEQIATVKAKTVNGEVQLQALVDGKKIIITESTVRRDLQLEDADGVDCLPNTTIFEQLTLMGYEKISQKLTFYKAFFSPQWKFLIHTILQCLSSKTTAWNEFSSTMASAIICLATNQKFNFSKYIFESMVKNLDNVGKFLMYPRFVQVFLDKQVDGMASHKRIYIAPSHTKKIFGNMRRVGKGFSGRETPLFQTMVVQDQAEMGEGSAIHTDPHHTPTFIQPSTSQPQMKQRSRRPKRKDTQVPQSSVPSDNVADEAVNEEMDDSLVRAATTATSLDAEQDRGNINKTRSKATLNEPSSPGTSSGSGPRCQETMGDTIAQTRFENVSKHSNDPLLARGNTLRSGEDRLKLKELMELCTNLQTRVLDLETTKTTQANEIASLKRRVKKLERRNKSRTHGLKRLYRVGSSRRVESSEDEGLGEEDASKQGRIADIDANEDIYLVNVQTDEDMFGVNDLDVDEVIIESVDVVNTAKETKSVVKEVIVVTISVSAATTTTTPTAIPDVEITLAQALAELKSAKPKADKVVIQESEAELVEESSKKAKVEIAHESSLKRAGEELKQESSKKQKLEEGKESEELKQCLEIVLDNGDDVTIDVTPLSTKSPTLEDLKVLWSIVKAGFKKTEPVNYMDNFLLLNLKIMFEHHVEDNVWKNQQGLVKVLNWKLYDSCRVHCMFNDVKLQVDYECEMAFELLRLVKKQLKEGYGRIVGIKSLLEVTATKVCVTAAKQNTASVKLVLLVKIEENILSSYYCLYTVNVAGV
ncbi:hypothetical protein Tco_0983467 [Tanacetum coccineum]